MAIRANETDPFFKAHFVLIYLPPECPSRFSNGKHKLVLQTARAAGRMIGLRCRWCEATGAYYMKGVL